MREILFKAKCIDSGEWVEGYYRHIPCVNRHSIMLTDPKSRGDEYPIIPETLCEYTGLADKNGNKIFENDILKAHLDDECPEDVTFEKVEWNGFGWALHEPGCIDREFIDPCDLEIFEVAGNSIDNPELLEVREW